MTNERQTCFTILAVGCFILCGLGSVRAENKTTLTLSVTSNGRNEVRHIAGRPLRLQITLSNPRAMNQLLDAAAAAGSRPAPAIAPLTLGTAEKPAATLLQFTISRDGN